MNDLKKTLMCLLVSGIVTSLWAQMPHKLAAKKPWKQTREMKMMAGRSAGVMHVADDIPAITVIDEDFSNFTAGTEDTPDATDIGSSGKSGYDIADGYMKEGRWTGCGVHQAGGSCVLMKYYSNYENRDVYGYLSTPEMELYGDCVVTFRARRTATNPDAGNLWLALCDNYEGPVDSKTYVLTAEWQQYEFVSSKATFNNINIFQFSADGGEIMLDDIKVTRKRNRIPAPEINSPINVSATEFIASWNPTATAKSYLFNAYYKDMPEGEVVKGMIEENFDGININADGMKINTDNPNYPEGWIIDLSKYGSQDVSTDEGWHNSGKTGLCFDAEGDYIISPETPAPFNYVSFWIRPSYIDYSEEIMSLLGVHILHKNGTWEQIANLPCYWMQEEGGLYEYSNDILGDDAIALKLTMEQKGDIVFFVDDVTIEYSTQPVPFSLIENEELTDTFRVVKDIDPDKEYYYYVQAKEDMLVSEPTYHVWVDGIVGVKPLVFEPTDVTATGFTANWQSLHNAQSYNINLYECFRTAVPNQEIVLLSESFDKAKGGTTDNPLSPTGWNYMFNLTEEGLTHTDWKGIYPIWADGMVGGREGSGWSRGGMLITPPLPLGDGGDVMVSFTAYNDKPGDKLAIVVLDNVNATQGIMGYEIPFSTTDKAMLTETVRITEDIISQYVPADKDYYVAFMTTTAGAFFLDEVEIKQIRKNVGETVFALRDFVSSETNSYVFSGLKEGSVYAYDITAYCYKDFMPYMSEKSDIKEVVLTSTGIGSYSVEGICNEKTVYYSITGQKLNTANLPKGVLVVKDNKGTRKVVNR